MFFVFFFCFLFFAVVCIIRNVQCDSREGLDRARKGRACFIPGLAEDFLLVFFFLYHFMILFCVGWDWIDWWVG